MCIEVCDIYNADEIIKNLSSMWLGYSWTHGQCNFDFGCIWNHQTHHRSENHTKHQTSWIGLSLIFFFISTIWHREFIYFIGPIVHNQELIFKACRSLRHHPTCRYVGKAGIVQLSTLFWGGSSNVNVWLHPAKVQCLAWCHISNMLSPDFWERNEVLPPNKKHTAPKTNMPHVPLKGTISVRNTSSNHWFSRVGHLLCFRGRPTSWDQ